MLLRWLLNVVGYRLSTVSSYLFRIDLEFESGFELEV